MEAFYSITTGLCFTLMGLWWGVVSNRKEEWLTESRTRKLAYGVYLSFLVPGMMALGAQLSAELRVLWRLFFVVAGGLGFWVTVWLLKADKPDPDNPKAYHGWFIRRGRPVVAALYLVIVVFGIRPDLAQLIDPGLSGLTAEGILITILVFLSISYAWEFMAEPKQKAAAEAVGKVEEAPASED